MQSYATMYSIAFGCIQTFACCFVWTSHVDHSGSCDFTDYNEIANSPLLFEDMEVCKPAHDQPCLVGAGKKREGCGAGYRACDTQRHGILLFTLQCDSFARVLQEMCIAVPPRVAPALYQCFGPFSTPSSYLNVHTNTNQ